LEVPSQIDIFQSPNHRKKMKTKVGKTKHFHISAAVSLQCFLYVANCVILRVTCKMRKETRNETKFTKTERNVTERNKMKRNKRNYTMFISDIH
jgi:hypothetical protein